MAGILLRGGLIVSMEHQAPPAHGDILVEGGRLAAIGPRLDAPHAQLVDASGHIVLPGLINAHQHTWQTSLRGVAANWTLGEYFKGMHAGLATRFTPDDIYIATLVGALNQINCGTTSLVDWCHNNPTPDHTDRAIDGLIESGIRAVFFHGTPKPDPAPGQRPFWEMPHPRGEIERLRRGRLGHDDGLVGLGMAILGPHYSTYEATVHDFHLAREFDLIASMHCAGSEPRTPGGWDHLAVDRLLSSRTNIVHGNDLTDDQLATMVEAGVTFSLAPEVELSFGHGVPITGRLRALGATPSIGVDVEAAVGGDLFTAARIALAVERAFDHSDRRHATSDGRRQAAATTRDALEWITVGGARMLGMERSIGTLAPGKQADLIMVRCGDLNVSPVHDPVATAVMQTSAGNIENVMIGGEWRKWRGQLVYPHLPARLRELVSSGQRLLQEIGLPSAARPA